MTRHQPVNAEFTDALKVAHDAGASAELIWSVFASLGAPHGTVPDQADYPVLGFHLTITAEQVLLYVITPGRFIRYEVAADSRALTIAVPMHKVARVIEQSEPGRLTVTLELDADTTTTISEYRESTDPADPAVLVGRTLGKSVRTLYELVATTEEEISRLMKFSAALRSSIGV